MGELTYNALMASTGLIIPLETDTNSIQGLYQIADIAGQMKNSNHDLEVLGVILTRYDPRPKVNKYLQSVIVEKCKENSIPYLGEIRAGIAVKEAQAFEQSIFEYAPNSKPAIDYMEIFGKITRKRKGKG